MPNHLNNETSPYLLQHAENPVDWYPWGEAAFRKARENNWQGAGREQLNGMFNQLRGRVRSAQYNSVVLYSSEGWQEPGDSWGALYNHQPLYADPMPGEAEMARVLADVSLDVQIVPLEKQVMVLFGWYGGNLAVYYDPVLDCFSGYALQQ